MEKKLTLNDILKQDFGEGLFSKKDKVFGLINIKPEEARVLQKNHSTKKHISWRTLSVRGLKRKEK